MRLTAVVLILAVPVLIASFYAGAAAAPAPAAPAAGLDGKALFLAQKCNLCHAIPAAAIVRTTKSEKVAGPDLPGKHTDAAFLKKYLAKQEAIEGKKHSKEVKASAAELDALVTWLLKQEKK
ncbi:MAG TPA: cytochrome c [Thermoanaerobaculia bacterium]|nr:cytochrome c [Thermoanaerobaculia bacterium]